MSESNIKLAKALLEAQKEMPAVKPDGENKHFGSKFVTLGTLIAKVRPVLNKHGISVMQMPSHTEGRPTLITRLMHENGDFIESTMPLMLPKQDPQGQGSALTYARRYALAAALGISDQEDDDGNAGSEPEPVITAEQLLERVNDSGLTFAQLTTWLTKNGAEGPAVESDEDALTAIKGLDPVRRNKLAAAALAYKQEKAAA